MVAMGCNIARHMSGAVLHLAMNVECLAELEQHVLGQVLCLDHTIMVLDVFLCPLLLNTTTFKMQHPRNCSE